MLTLETDVKGMVDEEFDAADRTVSSSEPTKRCVRCVSMGVSC